MIYLWMFLALCIVCVSRLHRSGTERGIGRSVVFFGMVILAALIYYFTMWLTGGNELVTGIFMFLAPACGLMIRFMVGYGRR
ncbi:YfdY family protein [Escherichia coli]